VKSEGAKTSNRKQIKTIIFRLFLEYEELSHRSYCGQTLLIGNPTRRASTLMSTMSIIATTARIIDKKAAAGIRSVLTQATTAIGAVS
jgi:hypothetical protein